MPVIANDHRFWNTLNFLKRLQDYDGIPSRVLQNASVLAEWMEHYAEVHFNGDNFAGGSSSPADLKKRTVVK